MRSSLTRVTKRVQSEKYDYVVYTDGACKGNPGPGGWGFAAFRPLKVEQLTMSQIAFDNHGGEDQTTNNRMELMAVIEALSSLAELNPLQLAPKNCLFVIDSQYVLKGVTEWVDNWKRRGWLKADKQPVVNVDLWKRLLVVIEDIPQITWCWVKGHSNDMGNELADQLANRGVAKVMEERQAGRKLGSRSAVTA